MKFLRLFGFSKNKTPARKIAAADIVLKRDQSPPTNDDFRFIAVDVETANSDPSSICQIGLAFVDKNNQIEVVCTLIDPQQSFDGFNSSVHGIGPSDVRGKPTFKEAFSHIAPILAAQPVVQHSSFDRTAIKAACSAWKMSAPSLNWVDSVAIARKAWPEFIGNGGHGLGSLKEKLKISFDHHDAGEDAKAAAQIVLLAEQKTGVSFLALSQRAAAKGNYAASISLEGSATGKLHGHIAVFTGSLTMSRSDAATKAAAAGISVKTAISKKTTLLVVGDQDLSLLAGQEKSAKHRKAEEHISNGQTIQILGETEFLALLNGQN